MRDFDKTIESLKVTFIKARHIKMCQPVVVDNFYDVENILLIVNHGQISYTQGATQQQVGAGEILFIPGGKATTLTYGTTELANLSKEPFALGWSDFVQPLQAPAFDASFDNCSYITFDAKVFDAVNLFASLAIPPLTIQDNPRLSQSLKDILTESSSKYVGSSQMIKADTERLTIEIVRHLMANDRFVEQLATTSRHLQDLRMVNLLRYIKDNLGGNLSNRTLAAVSHISEDYVGQYFKLLAGVNAQDYIVYQRMEQAVKLLRTTRKSIQDIGKEVGFKDTAYFCRRFKMMFGLSAGKMRKREMAMSASNVPTRGLAP